MNFYLEESLNEVLRRFREYPALPSFIWFLEEHVPDINTELQNTILAEILAFTDSGNPEILPELELDIAGHTAEIIRLLKGGRPGEFRFVLKSAERRAAHRFPLEATFHAYRCGHRIYSRWLRAAHLETTPGSERAGDCIGVIADFTMEYTDAISTNATHAYLAHRQLVADVAGDQRTQLLNILLDGYDESDGRVARILRSAGYLDSRQSFCVALAQPVEPTEMLNPLRALRLVDAIEEVLLGTAARRIVEIRDNRVTIIFSHARRASGWTAPRTTLAEQITPRLFLVGNAALIGVSNDVPSTSQIPTAYKEALLALELADVRHRVMQFSEIPARRLSLHFARAELQHVLPAWAHGYFQLDKKAKGGMTATLEAYANADMNVLKAAKILSVHPNTMYSRFQRIFDVTGLDAKSFSALNEILIVAECNGH